MFRNGPPNWCSLFTESHFPGWVGRRISGSVFSFPMIIRSIKGRTSRSQKVIPQPPQTRKAIQDRRSRTCKSHAKTMSTSWSSYRNARTVGRGQAPCCLPTRNSYPATLLSFNPAGYSSALTAPGDVKREVMLKAMPKKKVKGMNRPYGTKCGCSIASIIPTAWVPFPLPFLCHAPGRAIV